MARTFTALLICLAILLAGSLAIGAEAPRAKQQDKKAAEKAKSPIEKGYWAILVPELKLTDSQRSDFEKVLVERDAAIEKFRAEHGQEIEDLQAKRDKAVKEKDKEQAESLRSELAELERQAKQIRDDAHEKLLVLLDEAQRTRWNAFDLYIGMATTFRKAELTDAQKAQVRAECQTLAEAKSAGVYKTDKAFNKAKKATREKIHVSILTDEQRKAMAEKATRKDSRKDAPAKEKEPAGDQPSQQAPKPAA